MSEDKLNKIFKMRNTFMVMLQDKFPDSYPEWPVDLSTKKAQITCRETALKGVEEMFEALQHLKNWKPHRKTEMPEIDREEFLEEIVDAFNYFLSLIILIGVDVNEFYDAFLKKDEIIRGRLNEGY
tara:strand:+ start:51624 stop:52001 length:378 start_codon:yes stop_codon:yes gene_type:complete